LFFTRFSRTACLLLSAVLIVSLLSSRVYFENNRTFCACLLLLIGLSSSEEKPWLVRLQVALVYFGAALNKLLDPDWRSGQFFAFWFGKIHNPDLWAKLTHFAPSMPLAKLMDWTVIGVEFALVVGFLVPRFYPWAIWLGICYHTSLMVVMDATFGMFYYAMLVSYLAFVEWPQPGIPVFYDSDCGFCDATRRWFQRADPERTFDWTPLGSAIGRYGIPASALREKLHLVFRGKTFSGFSAFKILALYTPLVYVLYACVASLQARVPGYRWFAIFVLAMFSPMMRPAGDWAYNWIARRRYALSSAGCAVAVEQK
jgi:predicted DCC family thiol-disulfide oxidoreductase YuxK